MKRGTATTKPKRKQLGILVDEKLWRQFKAMAVMRGMTAGTFLEDAMRKALKDVSK